VITRLPAASAADASLMGRIADLVNAVYADSERGLWREGATRTTPSEVATLTRANQVVISETDGRLTGVVCVKQLDADTGEFGMLAADPEIRGRGIGRDLVRFAEQSARAEGCTYMQLELLVPRDWVLASKEFLAAWYGRLGYELQRTGHLEEAYPHLAPMLCTAADFRIYRKTL
jgi:GNAT superfamily N-acetyltransferase